MFVSLVYDSKPDINHNFLICIVAYATVPNTNVMFNHLNLVETVGKLEERGTVQKWKRRKENVGEGKESELKYGWRKGCRKEVGARREKLQ